MSKPDVLTAPPAGGRCPDDIRAGLQKLHAQLANSETDGVASRLVSNLSQAVEQLRTEHAGMAEELLGVYEQLGIIFEVTSKLPTVHTESDVVDLFVDNLRRSFQKRDVFAVGSPAMTSGLTGQACRSTDDWLAHLIREARERRGVVVHRLPEGTAAGLVAEALGGPVFAGDSFVCAIVLTRAADVPPFRASDMLLLESLTKFCGDVICSHRLVHELREMSIAMVRSLVNAIDQKDEYTSGHSVRVGYFAILLGKALGLGDADLQMLQWSALLHDVGKIGIRDDVLKKPGGLDAAELSHIREHPVRSYKVVQGVPQLSRALEGVLHHHERYDGSGYPSGIAGEQIPLQARIIQIADVFDALTSDRAYRSAHDWREALEIMRQEAGRTIDPRLQEVFARLMHEALDDEPGGWAGILQQANRFTHGAREHSSEAAGE